MTAEPRETHLVLNTNELSKAPKDKFQIAIVHCMPVLIPFRLDNLIAQTHLS